MVPVKPSSRECRICFVHNAVPFIGFGFLDNVVMIVAGDYIDSTLGVAFNISGKFLHFRFIYYTEVAGSVIFTDNCISRIRVT